jgi:hypothetical protein
MKVKMSSIKYLDWIVVIPRWDASAKMAASVVEVVSHWNKWAVWWNPV